jgi:hypothetical protein
MKKQNKNQYKPSKKDIDDSERLINQILEKNRIKKEKKKEKYKEYIYNALTFGGFGLFFIIATIITKNIDFNLTVLYSIFLGLSITMLLKVLLDLKYEIGEGGKK